MQESAVSAHSSPNEPADTGSDAGDEDGDGAEASDRRLEPDEPANSDASVGESTLAGQSSPEEPTESEAAIETNTTE
jgi:hypothetical protein